MWINELAAEVDVDWICRVAWLVSQCLQPVHLHSIADQMKSLHIRAPKTVVERLLLTTLGICDPSECGCVPANTLDETVQKAVAVIYSRAHEPLLRMSDVALHLGTSEWQISSRLKKATGCGFAEHLHQARIRAAQALLASTTGRIREIGQRVGYARTSDFIRHFRRVVGTTPGRWREKLVAVILAHNVDEPQRRDNTTRET
jgi:AraC-like DNA-binding protein